MASGDPHISFPCGECTITLEDVALQLGLPINGNMVTGANFEHLSSTTNEFELTLCTLWGCTHAGCKRQYGPLDVLTPIIQFALHLFIQLGVDSVSHVVLQTLSDDKSFCNRHRRMPHIAIVVGTLPDVILDYIVLTICFSRWSTNSGIERSYKVSIYRLMIENYAREMFSWMPYSVPEIIAIILSSAHVHSNLWCISAPVINFHIVEWYHGDRVLRQFGCIQYISTLPVQLRNIHGMSRRGTYENDWREVHDEYITMWNNRLGKVPQMDHALDLQPLLEYIQWYCEIGKPFLFGGRSMVVPPHTTRIGQPFSDLHHAPKPELHSRDSSYHPDFGGDDYFPGLSGYGYHSKFDIFSPLPHQYSSHPGSYPPPYSTPPGSYPPPYSTPLGLYPLPYSTPPGSYPPLYFTPLGPYPSPYSTPPGPYPPPYSTPPGLYQSKYSTPLGSSSSMAFETYNFSFIFRTPPHSDEENLDHRNRP
ncbi:hypothetical protein CXB51_027860 [Gossypium anomalum]|uniref:Aminotransferase-like plant mobile domain-containing protein n=1 Tax=Gossypium anomalum TaxID=47600 RepID=A0A8J6CPT3_9ROSI|nr:hypothetical protein CXB51_027860 [Gossypium anomalum]